MKKTLFLLFAVILFSSACHRDESSLTGHFVNSGSTIYLDEILPDDIRTIDTLLLVNGNFTYCLECKEEGLYRLRFSDTNLLSFIAGPNDHLEVQGDARDLPHTYRIHGNTSSEMLWKANCRINYTYALTDSLSQIFKKAQSADSLNAVVAQLDSCYYFHFQNCKSYLSALIMKHPSELAALPIFYQHLGTRPFFSEESDSVLFHNMVTHLTKAHPENPHIKALQERFYP